MQNFTDTLDCSIPQPTDAITPEEREEVKVSGLYFCSVVCENNTTSIGSHSFGFHELLQVTSVDLIRETIGVSLVY